MSFAALERSIKAFMAHPAQQHGVSDDKPLVFAALPIIEEAYVPPPASVARAGGVHKKSAAESSSSSSGAVDQAALDPAAAVYKIPEFAGLGVAFRSSSETALTETEMEYVVTCVKHVFEKHVVLQFSVLNTIDDQRLKDVRVNVDVADSDGYTVETTVPAAIARYGEKAHCFVCLSRNGDPATSTVNCELHFKVVQVDPATGQVTHPPPPHTHSNTSSIIRASRILSITSSHISTLGHPILLAYTPLLSFTPLAHTCTPLSLTPPPTLNPPLTLPPSHSPPPPHT